MRPTFSNAITVVMLLFVSPAHAVDLEIRVHEVTTDRGMVRVSLFDNRVDYLGKGTGVSVAAQKGTVTAIVRDVEPGIYAIAVYHDEDNDGELGANLFGIPSEGFGFSNNASARFGPPSFDEAAFQVEPGASPQNITLNY